MQRHPCYLPRDRCIPVAIWKFTHQVASVDIRSLKRRVPRHVSGPIEVLICGRAKVELIWYWYVRFNDSINLVIPKTSWNLRFLLFGFVPFGALRGLSGGWIVVLGTSNAQLLANSLLFMMAGSEASEHIHFGKYNFHDFMIENGAISYHNVISIDDMPICKQNTSGLGERERRCQEHWNANNLAKLCEKA